MIVRVSTLLDSSADRVWKAVKRPDTLLHVARGMMGFRQAGQFPERWRRGDRVQTRPVFFHILPGWRHELNIARVDEDRREIESQEHGGPVRLWRHRIRVDAAGARSSHYTDEIEIQAGWLTPLVCLFAHVFYRYRQMRWRRLARTIAAAGPAAPTPSAPRSP